MGEAQEAVWKSSNVEIVMQLAKPETRICPMVLMLVTVEDQDLLRIGAFGLKMVHSISYVGLYFETGLTACVTQLTQLSPPHHRSDLVHLPKIVTFRRQCCR